MEIRKSLRESARKAAEPVAKFLLGLKVSPNWVTVAGFLLAVISARYFAHGSVRRAGFVLLLAGLCDIVDGMLARLGESTKKFGAFLDSTVDRYSEGIVFLGLGAHYVRTGSGTGVTLVFVVLVGSFLISYVRARAEGLGEECRVGFMERPERMALLIVSSLIGGGALILGLWALAFLTHYTALHRIYYVYKSMERARNRDPES